MNIIKISEGLGHQMFQYAFYVAMRKKVYETGIDISSLQSGKFELAEIFRIAPRIATHDEIKKIADVLPGFINMIRRDLLKMDNGAIGNIYTENIDTIDEHIWNRQNTYFIGDWQNWRYFDAIKYEIHRLFKFVRPLTAMNQACAEAINQCESVSIHVRRGNYTDRSNWNERGSICSYDYYNWAIANIRQQIGDNVHYFVFSDDIRWVKENLPIKDATYVNWNRLKDSHNDMHLMSMCKHNIIANSTFSWWAAYLNENPDKIVIAPSRWTRSSLNTDIMPNDWIKLPID